MSPRPFPRRTSSVHSSGRWRSLRHGPAGARPRSLRRHAAARAAADRRGRLASDESADYLRTGDKAEALIALARADAQLAELRLRILATAGTWLAHATRVTHTAARADLRLAQALEAHPATAAAMRAGSVNQAQARVIVRSIDKLSDAVDELTRARAERHLIELAASFGPKDLEVLGARILDVAAPEIAEAELGKRLEREEQAAREKCSVKIKAIGDGISRVTALVPDSIAERLTTYLDAQDSPRVVRSRSRGEAFCRLLELLDPTRLPDHGGDATTVMVTITYDALTSQVGTAMLGTVPISASEARRLACTAKTIPAVLGGSSEILDLGRARRLYTAPQRKAMRLRDRRCRAEGCSIPAAWCEAHHLKPWSEGGKTDLDDGVLLCSHHHHRAHEHRYSMEKLPTGDWRFHRRT